MFLIGQYDSPFVRRTAIALRLYGLPFEHRPWSTFGDAEKIAPYNPLRRVPTLVLDDGEALIESFAILDYLDELVGPDKAMLPAKGPERRRAIENLRSGDRPGGQGGEPDLRAGAAQGSAETVGRALRGADRRRAGGAGEGARRGRDAMVVRRAHRPRRHRGRLRAALHGRGTSRAVRRALSGAEGACAACEALPPFQEIVQPLAPPSG